MSSYLQVENLSKSYGETILFSNISFGINKDQKVAMIAKNGAGKTSLLNIIASKDTSDSGKVTFRRDLKLGYLEQSPVFENSFTVLQQVFNSSDEIIAAIADYEEAVLHENQEKLAKAIARMDALEAWDYESKIKQILSKLNIDNFDQPVSQLSGGQKKRLALAHVLINKPDLLILDEPTNHLDLNMIEWLEEYLLTSGCTLLMVTHDRYFLDKVCNEIIEMDGNEIFKYRGNYSYYLEKREERMLSQSAHVDKMRNLLKTELDWMRRTPSARGTKAKYRIDNFYKIKDEAGKKINEERVEINIKTTRLGRKILEMYSLYKAYGDLKILDDFSYKFAQSEKIGIIGNNGCGKTTFLDIITGKQKPDSGVIEIGETVVLGYYRQDGISLPEDKRVIEVIKDVAEVIEISSPKKSGMGSKMTASQFLEYFLFTPEQHYTYVSKLSGGERRRLYLMTILMKNPNFLILDEPTNDLDIVTLNVLEDFLQDYQGCAMIVSHDRYFMDKVVDNLFVFEDNGKLRSYPGNYTDYRVTLEDKQKQEKKLEKETKPQQDRVKRDTSKKLSFKEQRELEDLEKALADLNAEKINLEKDLNTNSAKIDVVKTAKRLSEVLSELEEKEMRWLELSMKLE